MSDKCPKCGAEVTQVSKAGATWFSCLSFRDVIGEFDQGIDCTERQRDQLAEQVKRLREEVGKAWEEGWMKAVSDKPKSKFNAERMVCQLAYTDSRAKRISEGGE